MNYKIPVYQPMLLGNEKKYVLDCLDSNWISSKGFFVETFEKKVAEYIGINHVASVSNGTVALHLAMLALGIKEGDEVIVPTLTYVASVNAATYVGATPVFVDSLNDTWQIDPKDIEQKITSKTKAIMVVHLYGHPCDMDPIIHIAQKHNLYVIEDCAEAFGSYYKGKHVGTFGHIATFSFYGNKTITTGEGGAVITNDAKLHNLIVRYRGQGLAKNREYWHDLIGYNYRMTNICAAIGLAQLESIEKILEKKRTLARSYKEQLLDLPLVFHDETGNVQHSYWMVSILAEHETARVSLRNFLAHAGIETRPLFNPVHNMPMYNHLSAHTPIANDLGSRGINLPSWPNLQPADITFICQTIHNFYAQYSTMYPHPTTTTSKVCDRA